MARIRRTRRPRRDPQALKKGDPVYKAVVFDFGNVLCGLDRMAFARAASAHSPLPPEEIDSLVWGGSLEREHETGLLDSHGYYRAVQSLVRLDPDYGYDEFVADYKRIILPNPDGEEGLKAAAAAGARCFVLSNTSWLHACCIFDNEVLASVPEIHVLSYKVGFMKPDRRIWLRLLAYAGLAASECIYVDDVQAYCDAAQGLGFSSVRYDKNEHRLSQILGTMLK